MSVKKKPATGHGAAGKNFAELVFNRIRAVEGFTKDSQVADALRIERNTLASQKSRGIVPYDKVIEYSRAYRRSLEYLLNGNGPVSVDQMGIAEPGAAYRVETTADPAYAIAAQVHRALTELQADMSEAKFSEAVRYLHRSMIDKGDEAMPYEQVKSVVKLAADP